MVNKVTFVAVGGGQSPQLRPLGSAAVGTKFLKFGEDIFNGCVMMQPEWRKNSLHIKDKNYNGEMAMFLSNCNLILQLNVL